MEEFSAWNDDEDINEKPATLTSLVSLFDLGCDNAFLKKENSPLSVSGEFLLLPLQSVDPELCKEGLKISNDGKNRYGNVVPADETRVKINSPRGDYINANFVDLNPNLGWQMIASQAPTKKTEEDFWLMVFQYEVPVILMATKLFEGQKQKSIKYWPKLGSTATKGVHLELQTLETETIESFVTISKIRITQTFEDKEKGFSTKASHIVVHIYYTGWPDFGVPDEKEFRKVLSILDKEWQNKKRPLVCHCSAGIGRTGTIASILRFFFTKSESVKEIVTKIRKQRHGMVQTVEQFKFIFRYIEYQNRMEQESLVL
jgi:protein tyrosine phosphatase